MRLSISLPPRVTALGRVYGMAILTGLGRALSWAIPMLLAALAAAYLSFFYNQRANTLLLRQQQDVAALQQFRTSSSQLDQALGALSDALVDGHGVASARREMRTAISRNLSDAVSARSVLGATSPEYITGLSNLRDTVDNTRRFSSGRDLWQQSLSLMHTRLRLVRDAENAQLVAQTKPPSLVEKLIH